MQEINYEYDQYNTKEFFRDEDKLEILINQLSKNDYLSASKYICIEDTVYKKRNVYSRFEQNLLKWLVRFRER
ncbi:584_t:CDS:2 [Dentiscutata heterogama]|uniref:584_t:CDS:1 n=1 Tax=Dentiscutata heterogama TaxID=1316150 RepID=A0ACA9KUR2_9GLOM|nr:584_t:CDS:2 [Dentiscutata heterogama]